MHSSNTMTQRKWCILLYLLQGCRYNYKTLLLAFNNDWNSLSDSILQNLVWASTPAPSHAEKGI